MSTCEMPRADLCTWHLSLYLIFTVTRRDRLLILFQFSEWEMFPRKEVHRKGKSQHQNQCHWPCYQHGLTVPSWYYAGKCSNLFSLTSSCERGSEQNGSRYLHFRQTPAVNNFSVQVCRWGLSPVGILEGGYIK